MDSQTEVSPSTKEVAQTPTQGELEAAISEAICLFEREYMGRGPANIQSYLHNDFLAIRLQGVLTAAEKQLVRTLPPEKGRDLLKQVRTHLFETSRLVLEHLIEDIVQSKVLAMHHDVSTVTGEEVVAFTLSEVPTMRSKKGSPQKD